MLHNICLFLESSSFYLSQQHITELARNKSFWLNRRIFSVWTHLPNILSWKPGSLITGVFEGESPLDQLCHSFHFTWLCVMPAVYLSHKWLQRKFWQRRLLCQISHSGVLRRDISSHLSLPRTKLVALNPGFKAQKMVHDGFHPMSVMFVLYGAEGLILNPAKDEEPRLGLSPRRSHPCPTNRSATAEDFLQCSEGFSALLCAGSQ